MNLENINYNEIEYSIIYQSKFALPENSRINFLLIFHKIHIIGINGFEKYHFASAIKTRHDSNLTTKLFFDLVPIKLSDC